jgi:hypothetical protein
MHPRVTDWLQSLRDQLRRYRAAVAFAPYTAAEVRTRLRQDPDADPRTAAVHSIAAQTSAWGSLLSEETARDLGRAAHRLPTVLFWFRQDVPLEEIGRRLSPFGGSFDAERAILTAAHLVAAVLNRNRVTLAHATLREREWPTP